jgi:formate dehydrogenase major subunit
MDKIKLQINGQEVEAAPGKTILEVVREQGIDEIPTLCHSPELKPIGSCFLCVVEIEGRGNLAPSCATKIMPDMKIETRNERVVASRKTALELLLSNHYADCISPCMEGCPANVDAQGYIALAAMGQTQKAVDLIRQANPLPAVCGRVCVRKCEVVCRRDDVDEPVAINNIKRYVTDADDAYNTEPVCKPDTGKSVAIIGSGPAGLTAAYYLGLDGVKPVIYEALEQTGGMLRYGIPEYRLPDEVLDKEVEYICKAGAEIICNTRVGSDISMEELKKKHDALFIAAGAWTGKPMRLDGEHDTDGVVTGADWLPEKADSREEISGTAVIVGGGNTAMDAARTAWRLNAEKVIVVYRRTRAEMPADKMEIVDLLEEGVELMELVAPIGIIKENEKLTALRCQRMVLGEPDDSGRRRPVPQEGSEFDLPCNLLISAIGQNTVLDGLEELDSESIELTSWNTYNTNPETMATNIEGVFAGGDAADDGPTVAIDAIRDGHRAARAITEYLSIDTGWQKPFTVKKSFWSKLTKEDLADVKESPRHEVHLIEVEDRLIDFKEVSDGFEMEDSEHETNRCLSCGCVRFSDCYLRLYGQEYGVDMELYKGQVRKHKVDERHPHITIDPNKCILCQRCIRTCERVLPVPAIGLVNRGFRTEVRPAMDDPLVETNCVACGNCIDSCPTGSLAAKYAFPGFASLHADTVSTHCGFCSIGCELTVNKFSDDRYFTTASGKPGDYICRYGRFGNELFIKQERIIRPEIREEGVYKQTDFSEATAKIVADLNKVKAEHGAESVAVFISPELTNEEFYLAGKIARQGLGTNNIGSLAIASGGNKSGVLDSALGFTASTTDRKCLADADLIICNNTAIEADHLVLGVDIMEAVRKGAKMVVSNSVLDPTDMHLATLTADPMRGRSSIFWNSVLISLDGSDADIEMASAKSGVSTELILKTAELINASKNVVIIHGEDKPHDASPGDMETFSNILVKLNNSNHKANILLPRMLANSAGLEVMGADPAFIAGRIASEGLPGAICNRDLRSLLDDGKIRGAIVIGENPFDNDKTTAWFKNIEFLAAVDWTPTETTRFADVTLPGATYLETEGTRCNFEGRVLQYSVAVKSPAGVTGTETVIEIAKAFGLDIPADLQAEVNEVAISGTGDLAPYYWNTGQQRNWDKTGTEVQVETDGKASSIRPPVTYSQKYRKELREVGEENFRV